jgi:DNA-binding transcriptional regulator YiaG
MSTTIRSTNAANSPQSKGGVKKRKFGKAAIFGPNRTTQAVSVRLLRQRLGVSRKIFSRVVGFSERAIADWEAEKPLSDACLQRMREMSRLQEALAGVMREDFVGTWLITPNDAFDGLKPIEIIERGEIDRLWRMIYQLESGIPT